MKKARSAAIITVLLVVLSLIVLKAGFLTDSPEWQLVNAFQSSGASIVSSELYFKGKISGKGSTSLEELKKIASELAAGLGCKESDLAEKSIENDDLKGMEISGASGQNLSVAITAVKSTGDSQPDSCYITTSIVDSEGSRDIDGLRKTVLSIYGRYGITPGVNSCITGNYKGKLDNDELNDICIKIFKEADAKKVESISEKNLISVSAYAPSLGEAVEVNRRKVNLNLAIRYNSYEDKTYIWLATPVITTEY